MSDPRHVDPGPAQLKPLVFQVPKPLDASLPATLTSFIGRERELAEVSALLRRPGVRLITLTGSGGAGKSRLAQELARNIMAEFADGVAFVDLAPISDPDLVLQTIAHALGMRESGDCPVADRLVDALRDRDLLMLVDSFEPVVEAAPLIARLLADCPNLTVVATSREPLRLTAEWVITVSPLSLPDLSRTGCLSLVSEAEQLFVERAQAVRADFALTEANSSCVAQIVLRLDGLPLAIELAAARLTHLSPAALLQRLDRRLPLLTGGARDLPDRQRTLRGAIAWSYDMLSAEEQCVFRRLAVFSGGCTLMAAEAVAVPDANPGVDMLDILAALVSRSLLRQEDDAGDEPRFIMLDTIREFALEQLVASAEEHTVRSKHATHFRDVVARADQAIWGGPHHGWWLARLEPELPNLRVALAWFERNGMYATFLHLAGALGGLWHYRSHRIEGRNWIRRALATDDGTDLIARAVAFYKLGILEHALGGPDAELHIRQGMALWVHAGGPVGMGRGLMNLGRVLMDQERHDEATVVLEEAEAILERSTNIGGLATTRMYLGMVALHQGNLPRSHAYLMDALTLHQQDGFSYGIATTLLALGQIEAERGNMAATASFYAESLRLWIDIRSQEGFVDAVRATAALAITSDMPESAARLLGAASAIAEALGYSAPLPAKKRDERVAEAAQASLDHRVYLDAWRTGRALPPDLVAAEARVVLETASTSPTSSRANPANATRLTPREQDVLRLLVDGCTDREIAQTLGIKYRTVTSYVRNILDKLDVPSRTAAATKAVRSGLV